MVLGSPSRPFPATFPPREDGKATGMQEDVFARTFTDEPPPNGRTRGIPILAPKVGEPVEALILSDKVQPSWSHFRERVSYPCPRNTDVCPFNHGKNPPRWKGYLCGFDLKKRRRCLIELTSAAYSNTDTLRNKDGQLRGLVIRLARKDEFKESQVLATIRECRGTERELLKKKEWDLRACLLSMWGKLDDVTPEKPTYAGVPLSNEALDAAERIGLNV